MATKYRLTITEQDMETLHQKKSTGEPTALFLTPINPEEGLKELQIEVLYGERPVTPVQPEATEAPAEEAAPSVDDADITQAELTPGFTGESAVTSFDSFFKINEKKEEEEEEKDDDDKGEKEESDDKDDDSKAKSDKPKFGSPEWRKMYPPGKKGKKKKK